MDTHLLLIGGLPALAAFIICLILFCVFRKFCRRRRRRKSSTRPTERVVERRHVVLPPIFPEHTRPSELTPSILRSAEDEATPSVKASGKKLSATRERHISRTSPGTGRESPVTASGFPRSVGRRISQTNIFNPLATPSEAEAIIVSAMERERDDEQSQTESVDEADFSLMARKTHRLPSEVEPTIPTSPSGAMSPALMEEERPSEMLTPRSRSSTVRSESERSSGSIHFEDAAGLGDGLAEPRTARGSFGFITYSVHLLSVDELQERGELTHKGRPFLRAAVVEALNLNGVESSSLVSVRMELIEALPRSNIRQKWTQPVLSGQRAKRKLKKLNRSDPYLVTEDDYRQQRLEQWKSEANRSGGAKHQQELAPIRWVFQEEFSFSLKATKLELNSAHLRIVVFATATSGSGFGSSFRQRTSSLSRKSRRSGAREVGLVIVPLSDLMPLDIPTTRTDELAAPSFTNIPDNPLKTSTSLESVTSQYGGSTADITILYDRIPCQVLHVVIHSLSEPTEDTSRSPPDCGLVLKMKLFINGKECLKSRKSHKRSQITKNLVLINTSFNLKDVDLSADVVELIIKVKEVSHFLQRTFRSLGRLVFSRAASNLSCREQWTNALQAPGIYQRQSQELVPTSAS